MDLSRDYIGMCKKAHEIQEYYTDNQDKIGDNEEFCQRSFFAENAKEEKHCSKCGKYRDWYSTYCPVCGKKLIKTFSEQSLYGEEDIWLPRQDQLQDIIKFCIGEHKLNLELSEIFEEIGLSDYSYYNSMEQFWLAFTMRKKWNKIWDEKKKDWILFEKEADNV